VPSNVSKNLGVTQLNDKISLFHAFGIEVIITFLLAFTVYACIDKKRKDLNGSFPLAIGLSVTAGALFGVAQYYYILFWSSLSIKKIIFNSF